MRLHKSKEMVASPLISPRKPSARAVMERFIKRLRFDMEFTQKVYALIAEIDAIKGQWLYSKNLSPQVITRLQRYVLVTSSGASTRIEGSKLTDSEVADLFKNLRIKKFKDRDEQEVAGYIELLQKVFQNHENLQFTESNILHFHKELLKYAEKDKEHKGNYKRQSNRVEARDAEGNLIGIIFDPTPPYLVKKEMSELSTWVFSAFKEEKLHPLLIISNFIFEFLAIHPFADGNGRLSRILTNFLLLKSGYSFVPYVSHEKLVEENKADYYLALNRTQKTWKTARENIEPWIDFFLRMIKKQSELALKILTEEPVEIFLSEKQLAVWNFANEAGNFSRGEAIKALKLPARTIEECIKKLVSMKKLERIGEGRAVRYRLLTS